MTHIGLSDLQKLEIKLSVDYENKLHVTGPKGVLTKEQIEMIRQNKEALIHELNSKCEHMNVVNINPGLPGMASTPITYVTDDSPSTKSILFDPLADLEITSENRYWVKKQLLYLNEHQRNVLLREYRLNYLKAAEAIPTGLEHRKANAGTFTANTWLRNVLSKRLNYE